MKLFLTISLVSFLSCTVKNKPNPVVQNFAPLAYDKEVNIIELGEIVPNNAQFITELRIDQIDQIIRCSYDELMHQAKIKSRNLGANIIKITEIKPPDSFNSCYRIKAVFFRYFENENFEKDSSMFNRNIQVQNFSLTLKGLSQGEFTFYDGNGYKITALEYNKHYNQKTIKRLKKKFRINKFVAQKKTDNLKYEHIYFELSNDKVDDSTFNNIKYIISKNDYQTLFIEFNTILKRDSSFEHQFLKKIIENKIPKKVMTSWNVDSIQFGNQYINLGLPCEWLGVRNLNCAEFGQIDWTEFKDSKRAKAYIDQRINILKEKGNAKLLNQEKVIVNFKGEKIAATKCVLKIQIPKLLIGSSNTLIIYYLVVQMEQNYFACVLSHYEDNLNPNKLPKLLAKIITLE